MSNNSNFGASFKISDGKIMHVSFTPRYKVIKGYFTDYFDDTVFGKDKSL